MSGFVLRVQALASLMQMFVVRHIFFFFTQLCKIEKCYLYKYSFIKKKTTSRMSFLSFFGEFCPFMMHFQTISLCQESFLTSSISELEQ